MIKAGVSNFGPLEEKKKIPKENTATINRWFVGLLWLLTNPVDTDQQVVGFMFQVSGICRF